MQGQTPANGATPALRAEEALQKLAERLQRLKVLSLSLALLLFLRNAAHTVASCSFASGALAPRTVPGCASDPGPSSIPGRRTEGAGSQLASTSVVATLSWSLA